jgi:hypothetical protein
VWCYDRDVNPDDIRSFARRDWSLLADAKTAFWVAQKRDLPVAELLALADGLRCHAAMVRPDWPSAHDRAEDLAVHVRVSEALRAVALRAR